MNFGNSDRLGASQFLRSCEPRQKAPNSKLQAPRKHQAPSSKTDLRAVCPGICFWGLVFEIWNFFGAWGLVLGISLSAGSKTEMRPGLRRARSRIVASAVAAEVTRRTAVAPK